jgi:deazaflavin-dependent oxidoreductase (nitroreductase family)
MTERPTYQQPGWFTRNIFNRAVARLTRLGVSVWGSRVLEVRGRRSGEPRQTPVNILTHEGRTYLVAARGETQWVRNVRADGGRLTLILGRTRQEWSATELDEADRLPVLRHYLDRWKWEVGAFFGGIGSESTEAEWAAEARRHPVWVLEAA